MSDIETIATLIKQGQIAPVEQLLCASPITYLDILKLLRTSIEAMNLDILHYILDTFKPESQRHIYRDEVVMQSLHPGRAQAFKILREYNPPILTRHLNHIGDALGYAVLGNSIPLASFILSQAGTDPNKSLLFYKPPIEFAAYFGNYEMLELLLKYGARINGTNTVYQAMESGSVDMLSFLMSKKDVDINMVQPVEKEEELVPGPVLHLAVQTSNKKMVHVLVKKFGADPLVKDQCGKTAVDWARYMGDLGICRQLDPTYRQCQII